METHDIEDDDAESPEAKGYQSARARALSKRKPTTFEATVAGMQAIKELLVQDPKPDVITLMLAASEHVNTMDNEVRLTLREYIVDNGGSLEIRAGRLHDLFYSPSAACMDDRTASYIVQEEPSAMALTYNSPQLYATKTIHGAVHGRCRFPVGTFRPFNQSETLCCGSWFDMEDPEIAANRRQHAAARYCPTHRNRALRRGTGSNRSPAIIPPSHRITRSLKGRKQNGVGGYDS